MYFFKLDELSDEEKNNLLLASTEMQKFYTLRTKERQAVLNRIAGMDFKQDKK